MRGKRQPKRQVIVAIFTGVDDADINGNERWLTIRAEAKKMQSDTLCLGPEDSNSEFIQTPDDQQLIITKAVSQLQPDDRLYLIGHGDWKRQTIGGFGVRSAAKLFGKWNLPDNILISIIGCSMARDYRSKVYGTLVAHNIDSFASEFHKKLKEKYNNSTIVNARALDVGMNGLIHVGRKGVYLEEDGKVVTYKHDRSKVRFWWQGDLQMRAWVNYTTGELDEIDV